MYGVLFLESTSTDPVTFFACFNADSLCKPVGALDEQMGPRVGKGKHELK